MNDRDRYLLRTARAYIEEALSNDELDRSVNAHLRHARDELDLALTPVTPEAATEENDR